MIENYLIKSGLGCGTVKNFQTEVLKNVRLGNGERWYFKTPVIIEGNGLKKATIYMAFPFLAQPDDYEEKAVLDRLELVRKDYENGLINFFRKNKFIIPPDEQKFSIIPFWAAEKLMAIKQNGRDQRKDFAGIRIHILYADLTIKYRNLNLVNVIDQTKLYLLKQEQSHLEIKLDKLNLYNSGTDFETLTQEEKDLLTSQTDAMNNYNDCLKARILLLNS
jgi:hypothetical protein